MTLKTTLEITDPTAYILLLLTATKKLASIDKDEPTILPWLRRRL
jgi:hypothetical protein